MSFRKLNYGLREPQKGLNRCGRLTLSSAFGALTALEAVLPRDLLLTPLIIISSLLELASSDLVEAHAAHIVLVNLRELLGLLDQLVSLLAVLFSLGSVNCSGSLHQMELVTG